MIKVLIQDSLVLPLRRAIYFNNISLSRDACFILYEEVIHEVLPRHVEMMCELVYYARRMSFNCFVLFSFADEVS